MSAFDRSHTVIWWPQARAASAKSQTFPTEDKARGFAEGLAAADVRTVVRPTLTVNESDEQHVYTVSDTDNDWVDALRIVAGWYPASATHSVHPAGVVDDIRKVHKAIGQHRTRVVYEAAAS